MSGATRHPLCRKMLHGLPGSDKISAGQALAICLSMIFSESRFPLFGIML
jgi:hypothetical protein